MLIKSLHSSSQSIQSRINSSSLLRTGPKSLVKSQLFIFFIFFEVRPSYSQCPKHISCIHFPSFYGHSEIINICVHYFFALSLAHTSWSSCNFLMVGMLREDSITVYGLFPCTRDLGTSGYLKTAAEGEYFTLVFAIWAYILIHHLNTSEIHESWTTNSWLLESLQTRG